MSSIKSTLFKGFVLLCERGTGDPVVYTTRDPDLGRRRVGVDRLKMNRSSSERSFWEGVGRGYRRKTFQRK